MTTRYAERTDVPVYKSQAALVALVKQYGAGGYQWAEEGGRAGIRFTLSGRRIEFVLDLPVPADFARTPTGKPRTADAAKRAAEQEERRRFRVLYLLVKAKLEAVRDGIVTVEEEFLAHIVLPGGGTIGERTIPQIEDAYAGRDLPPLLPPGEKR